MLTVLWQMKRQRFLMSISMTVLMRKQSHWYRRESTRDVKFQGGCSGNTQGVARLVEGMDAKEAISRLEGIRCGFKPTSCPDQLAKALKQKLGEA